METKDTLTRNYIFEALYELLSRRNINEINVSEICEKAGVSRMSFYRNFKSKEDLMKQSLNLIVSHLQELIKNVDVKNEYTVIKCFFETFKVYKTFLVTLSNSPIAKSLTDLTKSKLIENLPEDKFNKTAKYLPVFYYSAIISVMFEWLNNNCEESPEEMARFICSLTSFDLFERFNDI